VKHLKYKSENENVNVQIVLIPLKFYNAVFVVT